jgi:hypothetical protein
MMFWMGLARASAMRGGRLRAGNGALGDNVWPDDVRKVANNAHNQFETPILFYVLCGLAVLVGATGPLATLLAWGYVASRVAHAAIQVTINRVRYRFAAFLAGVSMLIGLWSVVVSRLVVG